MTMEKLKYIGLYSLYWSCTILSAFFTVMNITDVPKVTRVFNDIIKE